MRKALQIPAEYYINRGYSAKVLDEYDVGFMKSRKSELYNRIVVPVYDPDGGGVIGAVGRSLYEKCGRCGLHHTSSCPTSDQDKRAASKWKTTTYFTDKHHLYNFWKAKEEIYKTRCVVITEGAGDVWRLVESGITNCVSVFGNKLSDPQEIRLQASGASTFIVARDMDESGAVLAQQVKDRFSSFGKVIILDLPTKDVGEMSVHQIRENIMPVVQAKSREKK